jgi:hypothetical protein
MVILLICCSPIYPAAVLSVSPPRLLTASRVAVELAVVAAEAVEVACLPEGDSNAGKLGSGSLSSVIRVSLAVSLHDHYRL